VGRYTAAKLCDDAANDCARAHSRLVTPSGRTYDNACSQKVATEL